MDDGDTRTREPVDSLLWSALAAALGNRVAPYLPAEPWASQTLSRAAGLQLELLVAEGWGRVTPALQRRALLAATALRDTRLRIHGALERAGVPHVFLKGAVTDAVWLGGRGRRGSVDLDVLVSPSSEKDAGAALGALGYRPAPPPGREALERASKERLWVADGRLPVDLHVRALNCPPFHDDTEGILSRAVRHRDIHGDDVPGPSLDDTVVLAAGNLAGDRFLPRHKMALDAWCALTRGADAAVVEQRARAGGFHWAWWALAQLLEARLGLRVDASPPPAWARPVLSGLAGVHAPPLRLRDKGVAALASHWPWSQQALWPLRETLRWMRFRRG